MPNPTSSEIKAILAALANSADIFEGFLRSIPPDALEGKRGQGCWSLHEHAAHLAEVQPMLQERALRILSEDEPEFIPFIPEQEEPVAVQVLPSVDEIVTQFRTAREGQLELLRSVEGDGWKRRALHPEYGQYGLLILVRHILMHDHWHMYRMEELWLTRDNYLTRLEG